MSTDPVKTQTDSSAAALTAPLSSGALGAGGQITASKDVENPDAAKVCIQWENRAPVTTAQTVWLVLYMIAVGAFFIDGAICVYSNNVLLVDPGTSGFGQPDHAASSKPCPNGWSRRDDEFDNDLSHQGIASWWVSRYCLSPALSTQWETCMADVGKKLTPAQKKLVAKTEEKDEYPSVDMWDILGRNVGLCLVVFPAIVGGGVAWFFALKNFPFQVVYATIGMGCAGLVCVAILFKDGGVQIMSVPILMAIGIGIATYLCGNHIAFTCRTISAACTILKDRPQVFGACFVLKLCWIATLFLLIWFRYTGHNFAEVAQTPGAVFTDSGEITEMICTLTHVHATGTGALNLFCFIWIVTWFEMAAVLVCAVAMGGYFFHRDDASAPQQPAFLALKWAFSSSAGAVSEASFTVTMSSWARRWATFNVGTCCCVFNPLWWILFVIYKCCQATIDMFSRFSLIMHGFHGGGMFTEGTQRPPFASLKKHLGTALVNGAIGEHVLRAAACLLSTILAFTTFARLDASEEVWCIPELARLTIPVSVKITIFAFFPIILGILIGYYTKYTFYFIMVFSLVTDAAPGYGPHNKYVAIVGATLFVGCLCMMVLQFFVDVVFHSTDGLIYCYVLAAESGEDMATGELREFHELIQDTKAQNAEAEPLAEDAAFSSFNVGDDKPLQQEAVKADASEDVVV